MYYKRIIKLGGCRYDPMKNAQGIGNLTDRSLTFEHLNSKQAFGGVR